MMSLCFNDIYLASTFVLFYFIFSILNITFQGRNYCCPCYQLGNRGLLMLNTDAGHTVVAELGSRPGFVGL